MNTIKSDTEQLKIRFGNNMFVHRLKLLIVIATIIFSIPEIGSADEWQKVFTDSSGKEIIRMSEFKGDLYAGLGILHGSASIIGLVDVGCQDWTDVTPPFVTGTYGELMGMLVFKDHLYVSTDQGQVFRSNDGANWEDITGDLPVNPGSSPRWEFRDLATFNGKLYMTGSSTFQLLDDTKKPYKWKEVFKSADSLEVLNDKLYAGIGLDNDNGVEIWRTTDGETWAKFYTIVNRGHVFAFKTFKGYLYVGDYHGKGISRTDGLNWERFTDVIKSGDVFQLEEYKNKLYLGTSMEYNGVIGDPLLYSSVDGKSWLPVPGFPSIGTKIISIASYGGKLYIGLDNTIYQYGSSLPSCGVWNTELINLPKFGGKYASIDIDPLGEQYISYQSSNYPYEHSLMNAERKSTIISVHGWPDNPPIWSSKLCDHCSEKVVDFSSIDIGEYSSIAVDSSGFSHISYYDRANGDLKYAKWDGEKWNVEIVDSEKNVGQYTSIALDSSGYPHISYYSGTKGSLKYAKWDGRKWDVEIIESGNKEKPNLEHVFKKYQRKDIGLHTSIVLDSSGLPHISYYDRIEGDLKYTKLDGKKWVVETVDSEGDIGMYTSIAVDYFGNPHISYNDKTKGDLKYAKWDGNKWVIKTVDSDGDVGMYTSIVLDGSDYPHISYSKYDIDDSNIISTDLKYAKWDGEKWVIESVDSTGYVGAYTSIDYSKNIAHISYYDFSHDALRYASREEGEYN